jgi:hypothetical protein
MGREWTKHGGHAARFLLAIVRRTSRSAASGDGNSVSSSCRPPHPSALSHARIGMSSTEPSARDDEIGSPLR